MKARWLLALPVLAALAGAVGGVLYLQGEGVTPRALAPYIEKRTSGHNAVIVAGGRWAGAVLRRLDRGEQAPYALPALAIGAQPVPAAAPVAGTPMLVASVDAARRAFAAALPGEVITFAPGVYRINGSLHAARPGTAGMPVVVRAERPGSVTIEFATREGFVVAAPYWTFENLDIRGACAQPAFCEHAFHVIGRGAHFVARNNTITDFNAHFKINGDRNGFPDNGLIEANTLTNSAPRPTHNPVTPVDLVAANGWIIRGNLITDFIKADGDRVSYGAFAKGAAANTVFERNVVLCEQKLQGLPGQRVGLSFGGGGTGKQYCRDRKCITEHDKGVMRANLVAACSDAGIYVNSAAGSRLTDNTLLDTAGVQVRYPESSAQLDGNLIDGAVTNRDGGVVREGDNRSGSVAALYAGLHPQRALFAAPGMLDLRWSGAAPRHSVQERLPDLCGAARPASMAYGAFEDFAACLAPRSALSSASTASNSAPN
ncbi:right-handed parallel beta-helix repeat-containing protein [Telluria aromaticivorans]|uniref:Right-handed parallel beta-helix repeat-containing protein n=1 Tax=Telluria aromaticivorans TaxID=2725995 RepID=A0A7Y2P0H8_9BURK|nr:right-handed parallel beta-helix repeat-containing protein [Telluria aromaticivorans]NNG24223.1 right-handed parallel beta-helix repeat-containing protein [Telluria aromaticivorans]